MSRFGESFKKVVYVLIPIAAYYLVHDLTRFLQMFVLQLIAVRSTSAYRFITSHDAAFGGIISIIDILAGVCVLLIIMRRDTEELSIWDYLNTSGLTFYRLDRLHSPAFSWTLLVIQALSMSLGINILIRLSGIIQYSSYGETTSAQYALPLWLGLILYGLVSPVAEELLFRLIVFGRLKRRFNIWISAVMTSLFFALSHGNIVQGIYGFIMGLLMCMACEYIHSVFGAVLIHCIANLTIYLLGMTGLLPGLTIPAVGIALTALGLITFVIQMYYSVKTATKLGDIRGVTYVGGFFAE